MPLKISLQIAVRSLFDAKIHYFLNFYTNFFINLQRVNCFLTIIPIIPRKRKHSLSILILFSAKYPQSDKCKHTVQHQ